MHTASSCGSSSSSGGGGRPSTCTAQEAGKTSSVERLKSGAWSRCPLTTAPHTLFHTCCLSYLASMRSHSTLRAGGAHSAVTGRASAEGLRTSSSARPVKDPGLLVRPQRPTEGIILVAGDHVSVGQERGQGLRDELIAVQRQHCVVALR
eukprot:CAMPEP_0173296324 /NCGR_PEP_ID=MMETSP1143-20121109/14887_2 /TAXON_ID=483371 /ORGANISM="non described non described, Strain CCMP2298" /LENGTH=149 /DNA_ID=CAMNT_0014236143 /DNA_START=271 /DNA_END=719 /DNA_ORIENTATION=-